MAQQAEEEGWAFTVGENPATQYTLDQLCGLVVPENWRENAPFVKVTPPLSLPSYYDWRDTGGCASVKNQRSCATCWAFATAGLLECNILIKDGIEVDLSEQWLVSCNSDGWGCGGGWWEGEDAEDFDFAAVYSADIAAVEERIERARVRQERSCALLEERRGGVDLAWMKRTARDRASEPSIDLDQTASSCVMLLPAPEDGLPIFWWCAARPSTSCYIPVFVHGSRLPDIVTTAGTYGDRVIPPSEAEADSFSTDSYWWLFRDLTDRVSADWDNRHPVVRDEFDRLEAEFEEGLGGVLEKAHAMRLAGDSTAAAVILDEYTAFCVEKAIVKVNELRERFQGEVVQIPAMYKPYVGIYIGNFGTFKDAEFEVKVQNHRLAVDVPGQMVFEMMDPDEKGRRYFALTNLVAVSFRNDGMGGIAGMRFHQTTQIPRQTAGEDALAEDITEEYRPCVGKYMIAPGVAEMEVLVAGGRLALDIPNEATIELDEPDTEGWRFFATDPTTAVSFDRDEVGKVTNLNLRQTFDLPRAPNK